MHNLPGMTIVMTPVKTVDYQISQYITTVANQLLPRIKDDSTSNSLDYFEVNIELIRSPIR